MGRSNSTNAGFWDDYGQQNQLFMQTNAGSYQLAPEIAGEFSVPSNVGRGLICGDLDQDGDFDVCVTSAKGAARIFRNDVARTGSWLLARAIDDDRRRDAYGAGITVESNSKKMTKRVQPSSSYLSHNDVRVHFGLADATGVKRVIVHWPDAKGDIAEEFTEIPINRSVELHKGAGKKLSETVDSRDD
jgi:hypothetical protein